MVGAVTLIANAHGNPWGVMSLSILRHSPFHSWLIPGILLLICNGLLPLWVLWLVLKQKTLYEVWIAIQGCVLLGWLAAEIGMLRVVVGPTYLYGTVGLILAATGLTLQRRRLGRQSPSVDNHQHSSKFIIMTEVGT
jgi:uncharacterized membrane protein